MWMQQKERSLNTPNNKQSHLLNDFNDPDGIFWDALARLLSLLNGIGISQNMPSSIDSARQKTFNPESWTLIHN